MYERADLRPEYANLRPGRADLRPRMALGGGGGDMIQRGRDEETERQRYKIALCRIIGHWPLRGRCPKKENFNVVSHFHF